MKSPYCFIVTPVNDRRYDNQKEIGGVNFITSVSEEDHTASNRFAIVVETPIGYKGPIKKGDTLLVHHNVFKFYNDMKGQRRSGKSFFKDDLFFVDTEQFFMWHDGDKWNAYDRHCFVESIDKTESYLYKPFLKEPLVGIMRYPSRALEMLGIQKGALVSFTPDSEYEFDVDGVKMYRIHDHQITMTHEK